MGASERELAVFVMGGTIDSRNAPERDGESVILRESLVRRYLEGLHLNLKIVVRVICLKDSRSITQEDRDALASAIQELGIRHNLVTHGTYTMKQTGEDVLMRGALRDKVIGFTGSLGTLLGTVDEEGRLMPSDGQFNLGYAVGSVFSAENGVYQLMNGETFKLPDEWWAHTPTGVMWKKSGRETTKSH
ncbi:MAG: asparaginase domain-containing protein [Candidatus Peribacteraceae bacterium]|nr:asparaginase domain-containing protein [Candidatus Peribacteraceae bacterium]